MSITVTILGDGVQVVRQSPAPGGKWDHRITVSHPALSTTADEWICGGEPLVDDTVKRCVGRIRTMLSLAHYISDNPSHDGFMLPAKDAMRAIAGMARVCEDVAN